jgi:hypothetical protein
MRLGIKHDFNHVNLISGYASSSTLICECTHSFAPIMSRRKIFKNYNHTSTTTFPCSLPLTSSKRKKHKHVKKKPFDQNKTNTCKLLLRHHGPKRKIKKTFKVQKLIEQGH